MTSTTTRSNVPVDEVRRRMVFADAALNLAGHQVSDPVLNEIHRKVAAEEITAEEGVRLSVEHIDNLRPSK